MSVVILKWNPSISSMRMVDYFWKIVAKNEKEDVDSNWSVCDWRNVRQGDTYFLVKIGGYGQCGIVSKGTIISAPYESGDWSGRGRSVRYVDLEPDILINPDVLPILDREVLSRRISDFNWDRGASGVLLEPDQADLLMLSWEEFLEDHKAEFFKHSRKCRGLPSDRVWISKSLS